MQNLASARMLQELVKKFNSPCVGDVYTVAYPNKTILLIKISTIALIFHFEVDRLPLSNLYYYHLLIYSILLHITNITKYVSKNVEKMRSLN